MAEDDAHLNRRGLDWGRAVLDALETLDSRVRTLDGKVSTVERQQGVVLEVLERIVRVLARDKGLA